MNDSEAFADMLIKQFENINGIDKTVALQCAIICVKNIYERGLQVYGCDASDIFDVIAMYRSTIDYLEREIVSYW